MLPHGTGKEVRVGVFAPPDEVEAALAAGADLAGGEELIKQVQVPKPVRKPGSGFRSNRGAKRAENLPWDAGLWRKQAGLRQGPRHPRHDEVPREGRPHPWAPGPHAKP